MKRFLMVCVALLLAVTVMNAQSEQVVLHVIETSDVHGCFLPYDFINAKDKPGSLARVQTYVKQLRKDNPGRVVLLDNGDILQGQPICYYYNYLKPNDENVAASVINYMGYDAETIGNHDVETGHKVYDKWIKEVHCPMLGANVINTQTGKPYLKPYTLLYRGGIKIAVLGMITPAIPNWLNEHIWSGLRFDEMVSTARKWVDYLQRNEHPDVIIGLFHSGWDGGIKTATYCEDAAKQVAEDVPGFDLILFGHDHTRHDETLVNQNGTKVVCLDPANNAMTVAHAVITLTKEGKKVVAKQVEGQLVDVSHMDVDAQFVNHFKPQADEVKQFVSKKIGTFKHTIYTKDSYFGSSAFNDLIANLELSITGADIAFNAPLSFNDSIKAGDVTMADMFKLYKYENQLYVMRLRGDEVRKHLEMSYDQWVGTMKSKDDHLLLLDNRTVGDQQRLGFKNFSFNFDAAAGIDYVVDVTKPDGQKVHILRMSDGRPFDENKWYKVAINSYRANGGGELLTRGAGIPKDSLTERTIWQSELDQRYYLMKEIEKAGTLDPKPNNNWKLVPEEWTIPAAQRDRKLLFGE